MHKIHWVVGEWQRGHTLSGRSVTLLLLDASDDVTHKKLQTMNWATVSDEFHTAADIEFQDSGPEQQKAWAHG